MHACPQGPPANRLPTCCSRSYASSVRSYSFLMWNDSCRWLCGAGRDRCSGAARGMRKALGKPVPPRLPCRRRPAQGKAALQPAPPWLTLVMLFGGSNARPTLAHSLRLHTWRGGCECHADWAHACTSKYGGTSEFASMGACTISCSAMHGVTLKSCTSTRGRTDRRRTSS